MSALLPFPSVLRRLPFTLALAATILITTAVTGTMGRSISTDQLAVWGFGASDFDGAGWLKLAISAFQIFEPYMATSMLATVLALVGSCEYRLGTKKTVVVFALSHVAGLLAVIGVAKAFASGGGGRGMLVSWQQEVGASAGSIGCLGAWLVYFPGRLRAPLIVVCALFLAVAFAGQVHPWDVAHAAAFPAGVGLGVLMRRRMKRVVIEIPRADRRLAVSWIAVIVGLAAALAPFVLTEMLPLAGLRGRFGERGMDAARWLFLLAGIALWICSPGLRRGERRAWGIALAAGMVTCVGLSQSGAPSVEHILSILMVSGLFVWRREFREPTAVRTRWGRRMAAVAILAAVAFGVFGFVALRWKFAPPLDWEGSMQSALARLRFEPVRTPNWDSPEARWFLDAFPVAVYAGIAVALVALIGSGFSGNRSSGESFPGRSVKSA